MSTKVEVFTSPGWEAEVDTDWAEGLFAVFLRSAKGHRRGARGATKVIGDNAQSDGVILLTVRKDGAVSLSAPPPEGPGARGSAAALESPAAAVPEAPTDTRRSK